MSFINKRTELFTFASYIPKVRRDFVKLLIAEVAYLLLMYNKNGF